MATESMVAGHVAGVILLSLVGGVLVSRCGSQYVTRAEAYLEASRRSVIVKEIEVSARRQRLEQLLELKACLNESREIEREAPCAGFPTRGSLDVKGGLQVKAIKADNVTDGDAKTVWCGFGPRAKVHIPFEPAVFVESISIIVAQRGPAGIYTRVPPTLAVVWDGGSTDASFTQPTAPGVTSQTTKLEQINATTGFVEVSPPANAAAGMVFCISEISVVGRSAPGAVVPAEGSLVLGLGEA